METKVQKNRLVFYIMLFVIGVISCINSSENSIALIQRVFKPIAFGNHTFNYSFIIPIGIFYVSQKKIFEHFVLTKYYKSRTYLLLSSSTLMWVFTVIFSLLL